MSLFSFFANCKALKATAAESPPSIPETTCAPTLLPHVFSCSTAAALNVSEAAKTTDLFWSLNCSAILPAVVVFPEPFTPAKNNTCGLDDMFSKRFFSLGNKICSISEANVFAISNFSISLLLFNSNFWSLIFLLF